MAYLESFKTKFNNFRRLPDEERRVLIQALAMLPVVAINLRLGGLVFTRKLLTRFSPEPRSYYPAFSCNELESKEESLLLQQARITNRLVKIAAGYQQPWANCLGQSLLLWWLLRRQLIESDLQIGVRYENGKFEAHAWVEYQGSVLNDRKDVRQRFTAFEVPAQDWRIAK